MNENIKKEEPSYRWGTFLIGGILVVLYISFCVTLLGVSLTRDIPINISDDKAIDPTPTIVLTPQILLEEIQDKNRVEFENFTSNYRDWGLYYLAGKVEVINGKMIFQSSIEDIAIASNENFIKTDDTYYVQAELVTDIFLENQQYGLVFGISKTVGSYYLYEISPEFQSFRLFKFSPSSDYQISNHSKQISSNWELLIDYTDAEMKQYPQENTLSVHVDKGNIKLFINGNQVGKYTDEQPLQFSGVGVYVNTSGYRLIVDNFFGYSE